MLQAAAQINDLDEALRSVMDVVGIDDGGVAALVFSGDDWNARWPDEHHNSRMAMLRKWADAEESYAGPGGPALPPDPDELNDKRAEWADRAIVEFQDATGTDREDALADLLCNLMHWCDRNGFGFDEELEHGRGMYQDEVRP
jgi:hypothetical protein